MLKKATAFLEEKKFSAIPGVIVLFGDDEFLRSECRRRVRTWIVGETPSDFVFAVHEGPSAKARDVLDELFTPSFLGDRRLSIVEDADKFVTQFRDVLLEYAESPSDVGVLCLDVKTFPSNTKLYKEVEKTGMVIECKTPQAWHVASWCQAWAEKRYGKKLDKSTADWLVELVGPILGLLDQELQKLATSSRDRPEITLQLVRELVVGTKTETAFKLLDLALENQLGRALDYLDRQLLAGESPVGILAMLTSQLRKFAKAYRETETGSNAYSALKSAGVPPFAIEKSVAQFEHFGRDRLGALYRRLLRADLDLKGASAMEPRTVVERLLVELCLPAKLRASY